MGMREAIARMIYPVIFAQSDACEGRASKLYDEVRAATKSMEDNRTQLNACNTNLTKAKDDLQRATKPCPFEDYLNENFKITTLVYTKRWIRNGNNVNLPVPMDVRDFINADWTLPKLPGLREIFTYNVRYVTDSFAYNGILDWWQIPQETLALNGGDCEDSAVLKASLALRTGFNNIFCALGFWGGVGHCFNLMWDNGKVYIVENTSGRYEPKQINSIKDTGQNYQIYYIFNNRNAWTINNSVVFGAEVMEKEFNIEKGVKALCRK